MTQKLFAMSKPHIETLEITNYPVLLAEDNPDDVLITKRAWKKGGVKNPLLVVKDGEEAIQFLKQQGEFKDVPRPCLMLLDLKMPRVDGFEVLKFVKTDEDLKSMPVVVLTTSNRDRDVEKAYQLGCNGYIVKPVNFENFIKAITDLEHYWLILSESPFR